MNIGRATRLNFCPVAGLLNINCVLFRLSVHGNDAISPQVFCLIQRLVGCPDEMLRGQDRNIGQDCNATADCDIGGYLGMLVENGQFRYGFSYRFGNVCRPSQFGFRKDECEFLATISSDHVRRTVTTGTQRGCYALQALITGLMSIVVVVCLKNIDIAHHQRQRSFATTGEHNLIGKVLVEEPPIGKACQRVVQG